MNDFHSLDLTTCKWSLVKDENSTGGGKTLPGHRFCHVAVVEKETMFVFGGYDGSNRLNDFLFYRFSSSLTSCAVPSSTLIEDLKSFVDNPSLSDITFLVEDTSVHAHRIMLMRCEYFKAMLEGGFRESTSESTIKINDVSHAVFLKLLEYVPASETSTKGLSMWGRPCATEQNLASSGGVSGVLPPTTPSATRFCRTRAAPSLERAQEPALPCASEPRIQLFFALASPALVLASPRTSTSVRERAHDPALLRACFARPCAR
jgi:hypothetical protein